MNLAAAILLLAPELYLAHRKFLIVIRVIIVIRDIKKCIKLSA